MRTTGSWAHPRRRLLLFAAALAALAALLAIAAAASASSYPGAGNWVIPAATSESVVGETINVSGNVTVLGSLTLTNSTLIVQRNVSVSGTLELANSTLTFITRGPGTNYLTATGTAVVTLRDNDNLSSTPGDASVLNATPLGFNSSFSSGARLTIWNSRAERMGVFVLSPPLLRPGFRLDGVVLDVAGSTFTGAVEAFIITNSNAVRVSGSSFSDVGSAINLTGGSGHLFENLTIANFTYGVRTSTTTGTIVRGLVAAGVRVLPAYNPMVVVPFGTAVLLDRATNASINGGAVSGPEYPALGGLPYLTGFVVRDSVNVSVWNFTGRDGDRLGELRNSAVLDLQDLYVSGFSRQLLAVDSGNIVVAGFRAERGNGGMLLLRSSNLQASNLTGESLSFALVFANSFRGILSIRDASATNSSGVVNVTWDAPGSVDVKNITVRNVTYGVALTGGTLVPFQVQNVRVTEAAADGVTASGQLLEGALFTNLSGDTIAGWLLRVAIGIANNTTIRDLRSNATVGGVVLIAGGNVSNLMVSAMDSVTSFGPQLSLDTVNIAENISFTEARVANTTGLLFRFNGGSVSNVLIRNLTLENGGLSYPTFERAAVELTALYWLRNVTVRAVAVNNSTRGGVVIESAAGGEIWVEDVAFLNLVMDGVAVLSSSGLTNISVDRLRYENSSGRAVALLNVTWARTANISAAGSEGGVSAEGVGNLSVSNLLQTGFGTTLYLSLSSNVSVTNITSSASFAFDLRGSRDIAITGASVSGLIWVLHSVSVQNLTVIGLNAKGSGGGIYLKNQSATVIASSSVEFSGDGLTILVNSSAIEVADTSFSSPPGQNCSTFLTAYAASDLRLADLSFSGRCLAAGELTAVSRVVIDNFTGANFGRGLAFFGSDNISLLRFSLTDIFNGTALGLTACTDVLIDGADLIRAAGLSLIVTVSARVSLRSVVGGSGGGGGATFLLTRDVRLVDSSFGGSGGAGLQILNTTGPFSILNLRLRGNGAGLELFNASSLSFVNVDVSFSQAMGVLVDEFSRANSFRNLTLHANGGDGVLIAVDGTALTDGNFSANRGRAVVSAPGVRVDWTIEVAGSLADDEIRLTGDLIVRPFARFELRNATVVVDQTARSAAFQPPTAIDFGTGSVVVIDGSRLSPANISKPFSVSFGIGTSTLINGSSLSGGGRQDARSLVSATSDWLRVANSSFTGWNAPLSFAGAYLEISDSAFFDNEIGPSLSTGVVAITNLNSSFEEAEGLLVSNAVSLSAVGLTLMSNRGEGARIAQTPSVTLERVESWYNSRGGLVVTVSQVTARGLSVLGNLVFAMRVFDASFASFKDSVFFSNGGPAVSIERVSEAVFDNVSVDSNGGTGLTLTGIARATLRGGEISRNGAFGLMAMDVTSLAMEGMVFQAGALPSVSLDGALTADMRNVTFLASPGYAVTLHGNASANLTDCRSGDLTGSLLASDSSYAHLLNSTFRLLDVEYDAQVDVAWFLRVIVLLDAGAPSVGAAVEVREESTALVGAERTNAEGATPLIAVLEKRIFANRSVERLGPHWVTAATNADGRAVARVNITEFTVLTLRLDPWGPATVLTLDGPAGLLRWFLGPVTAELAARDDRAFGLTLYYRVGGGDWLAVQTPFNSTSVVFEIVTEESTVIEFFAVDSAGNIEPTHTETVRIDSVQPTASFAPLPGILFSANFTLAWSGDDFGGSGIVSYKVEVSVDGGPFAVWLNATPLTSAVFSGTDASYRFRLWAIDAAGWASPAVTLETTVALFGSIQIGVIDPEGRPVSGATVRLEGTNISATGRGDFLLRDIPAGNYTLVITAPGFEPFVMPVTVTPRNATLLPAVTLKPVVVYSDTGNFGYVWALLGLTVLLTVAGWLATRRRGRKPQG